MVKEFMWKYCPSICWLVCSAIFFSGHNYNLAFMYLILAAMQLLFEWQNQKYRNLITSYCGLCDEIITRRQKERDQFLEIIQELKALKEKKP